MANLTQDTGTIEGLAGVELFYRWDPVTDPKGAVVIVHGLAEHSGRYAHVVAALNAAGYSCMGVDLRGHGRSSGRRVFLRRFSEYVDDVQRAVRALRRREPEAPLFVIGHSMGGVVALLYAIEHGPTLAGVVLSAPGLRAKIPVPPWKDALGRLMSKVWPTLAIPTGIPPRDVSRDPEVVRAYEADPLVTKKATARWYTEFLGAQDEALRGAPTVTVPALVLAPLGDRVVDPECYHQVHAALGSKDKTLKLYPGLFHEVFNEPEKDEALAVVTAWLDGHAR